MIRSDRDITGARALVIDSNPTSRGVMVAQLWEFGMKTVVQCSRVRDALQRLELSDFDFVLCEHHFGNGSDAGYSGQALLDDLRRANLLPFSTVFIMVTGEATYAKVAEAAESALDGYLLKPYSAAALHDRLSESRRRKNHLGPIFEAVESGEFERAAQLCLKRFDARDSYWLYAARIGAELLLRVGRHDDAQKLFESVIEAKTLPWARLGIARAQLESGKASKAVLTLEGLIGDDPEFADAYDVLGRAHFDSGNIKAALDTYQTACDLTPSSVARLQKFGMMAFFSGDRETAERVLHRATVLGIESKMFDLQSLVLLALMHLQGNDGKALQRCRDQLERALERDEANPRTRRLARVAGALLLIQQRQVAQAVESIRAQAQEIRRNDFNFEAACNFAALLAALCSTSIDLDEAARWIHELGMRFCGSRGASELLANAAAPHPPYVELLRQAHAEVTRLAEQSMSRTLAGDPRGAIEGLLQGGRASCNVKLLDLAHMALLRHEARIPDAAALRQEIDVLREQWGGTAARTAIGQDTSRPPGSISLRVAAPVASHPAPAPESVESPA
jgi:CheY-like chemotaxis protein